MAELFYKEERNSDFMHACELVRRESGFSMPTSELVARALLKSAQSFYLHPREYSKIIKAGGGNLPKNAVKKELHCEILRRSDEIRQEKPTLKIHEVAQLIGLQDAPRFYLSPRGAISLYYKLLKKKS